MGNANKELAFQIREKEKNAEELGVANKKLAFQNAEKEKRAEELVIANKELAFQNAEKEKRAEELVTVNKELRMAEHHIVELNVGLEQKIIERTAQLEAANKELESFSYSVSHDLRAPLRAINGFTKVLVEDYLDKLDNEAKEILDEIVGNSKKMGELIDDLLEFSRVGKQQISMANINMQQLAETVVNDLEQTNPDKKTDVTIKKLEAVKGDKSMLKQALINLISNAFKYSGKKEQPVIEIGCYPEDIYLTYYVKDNGAGFEMQYYHKLFGVFQRLHSSNEFEGTGVGLALVQRIILKHGGKVWAEGKVGEGACFYISLPVS